MRVPSCYPARSPAQPPRHGLRLLWRLQQEAQAQRKRLRAPAASSSTIATNCSWYCLDKPRNGGNTLRRQCMKRECANAEGLGLEDAEISPYTLDAPPTQAIAHGKLVCGHTGSDEENDTIATPNKKARKDEGPPSPVTINGKRTCTDAPGRPTHTYQKAVMSRFYELKINFPTSRSARPSARARSTSRRARCGSGSRTAASGRRRTTRMWHRQRVREWCGPSGLPMPSAPNNKNGIGSWYHTDLSGGMQMSTTAAAAEALKRANNKASRRRRLRPSSMSTRRTPTILRCPSPSPSQ